MTDLTIHDVPPDTLDAIAARARRRGQSVEAAVLELMQTAASEERLRQDLERGLRTIDNATASSRTASRSPRRYRRSGEKSSS